MKNALHPNVLLFRTLDYFTIVKLVSTSCAESRMDWHFNKIGMKDNMAIQ
jgi:hypothetical protein